MQAFESLLLLQTLRRMILQPYFTRPSLLPLQEQAFKQAIQDKQTVSLFPAAVQKIDQLKSDFMDLAQAVEAIICAVEEHPQVAERGSK